ncbi:MAG: mechanosensitive ion channel, partial [Kiritimatiellae bacterium]|nr:mechanosensitive ion channel [Kiritimatiellia bacterium]
SSIGLDVGFAGHLATMTALVLLAIICVAVTRASRFLISAAVHKLLLKTSFTWDDTLVKHRVFIRLANFAPVLVVYLAAAIVFPPPSMLYDMLRDGTLLVMIVLAIMLLYAAINAVLDVYDGLSFSSEVPLKGFAQVIKIIIFLAAAIFVISLLTDKSPLVLLGGIGAMTAVLMLVFKDVILGFVAGIQLIANRMIARGDWLEMPSHGADGDVIDVSLTTVKVQNWDKTISTIPTYSLISESFKNWRGMSESDGRRIKRSVHIDMNTIRFCDEAMLERYRRIQHITGYIESKQTEVDAYNQASGIDAASLVNGRRLTNIGTFRAYVVAYLKNHPMISDTMTFIVRQLQPGETGVPIEVYVFSKDKVWANYEAIQSDIFDHILASVPAFDLRLFQHPSGHDLRALGRNASNEDSQ